MHSGSEHFIYISYLPCLHTFWCMDMTNIRYHIYLYPVAGVSYGRDLGKDVYLQMLPVM